MTLQDAVNILKQYVKESAVPGQKHISPDLVNTKDMDVYQKALKTANDAVLTGELDRAELMKQLGLGP